MNKAEQCCTSQWFISIKYISRKFKRSVFKILFCIERLKFDLIFMLANYQIYLNHNYKIHTLKAKII